MLFENLRFLDELVFVRAVLQLEELSVEPRMCVLMLMFVVGFVAADLARASARPHAIGLLEADRIEEVVHKCPLYLA